MAPFVWHDEFYKECYPKLYGLALRNVHNAQLAQDMVQEAFRILFEKWTTGQNPAGRPYRCVAENRGGKLLPNRNAENELPRKRAAFGFGHNTRRG